MSQPKILVATTGKRAARELVDYVVEVAKALRASLVAVHVAGANESIDEAAAGPEVFRAAAEASGVAVETKILKGAVVNSIVEEAEAAAVDIILMGASEGRMTSEWVSAEALSRAPVPVLVIPHALSSEVV